MSALIPSKKQVKDDSISNFQIDHYYANNKLYGGCFSKDLLRNKSPDGKFYIINLQNSNAGNGSHWVAITDFDGRCLYVDSYGIFPPPEIEAFMSRSKNSVRKYSDDQLQEIDSSRCGYFCIYVINSLLANKGYMPGLSGDPSDSNERIVGKIKLAK